MKSINQKMHVWGTFCDLAIAFDCAAHEILIQKLHYCGIQGTVAKWFKTSLTNKKTEKIIRKIFMKVGKSKTWSSRRGQF